MQKRQQPIFTSPECLIGKTTRIPDIKRRFAASHREVGWAFFQDNETQAKDSFNGNAFQHYERIVLGKTRRIQNIYFPAAYTGKVALALSEAGYDVFASDLSDYWSGRLQELGLRSEKRSFDEIPDEKFDAVVSFEPYCVGRLETYSAILRTMARDLPYIEIQERFNENTILQFMYHRMWEKTEAGDSFQKECVPNFGNNSGKGKLSGYHFVTPSMDGKMQSMEHISWRTRSEVTTLRSYSFPWFQIRKPRTGRWLT